MIILCDVAELSGVVVTLCNGVDFSVDIDVLISELSSDVVDNLVSCDVYDMLSVVVLIVSLIS